MSAKESTAFQTTDVEYQAERKGTRIVRTEFHDYHVTRETDHGPLESGIWEGQHFISGVVGCGNSWEAAERDLERGGTLTTSRIESR